MTHKVFVSVINARFPSQEEVTCVDRLAGSEIEKVVDEDLVNFDEFFQKELGNSRLVGPEKAVIKTYLAYKLGIVGARKTTDQ